MSVKSKPWNQRWFAGAAFSLVFLFLAYILMAGSFESLERVVYDSGLRLNDQSPAVEVAVVAIDDQSIENLGRWPWSRSLLANMIDKLREGGAKVVGNTLFLSEPQTDPGLLEIEALLEQFRGSSLYKAGGGQATQMERSMLAARTRLDADGQLAMAYQRYPKVIQAFSLDPGYLRGRPDPVPPTLKKSQIAHAAELDVLPAQRVFPTIDTIAQHAAGQGHLTTLLDGDGVQRSEALVVRYFDEYYPSLALALAAEYLNLKPDDIRLEEGAVELGGLRIATTPHLRMYNHYYEGDGQLPAFDIDSFFDVLVGNIPVQKYQGKIVIIGPTATGVGDRLPTPIGSATTPAEIAAHTVASILSEDFYVAPGWGGIVTFLALLAAAAWISLGITAFSAGIAALISFAGVAVLLLAEIILLSGQSLWIPLVTPALMIITGHLFVTIKSLQVTELLKASSELESAESNRMLGIAFQSQGQLDMAFEKFRKCPRDENILEPVYNLAMDYERKRQFNKAISCYEFIMDIQADFRDAKARRDRAAKLNDTVMLGGSVGAGTLMMSGDDLEKPMLGRYEVQKELGKGAMGVVYLGQDPKIGRTVAIKTMALSQEFEADELEEVKERFFREAETAGRLTHPNIVTIYDAGEEHDLAYIAMEFIKGYDLTKHVKTGQLLDPRTVLKLIADAAEALDYAHQHNVIHRDIKPANLMWLPEAKQVKVTDFGIARLTDSSKTKTGMVLGTPSYMSPEQLAGHKVDGRTDLFSLGVTLYQMLTGKLPFVGESMATLMFKIANEQHTPIGGTIEGIDPRVDKILNNALQKDREKRYKRGADFARHLRILLKQ